MSGPTGSKVFKDYLIHRTWLLDARSRTLCALGRWDEGAAQLMSARFLPESGESNVSQTINLASLYNDLGKPKEALQTLADLGTERTSPYGAMQVAIERLASADQLGDTTEAEKQLGFLREHRDDSLESYQRALISANHQDEAAALLISRLQDPDQRLKALMELQKFKLPPLPKICRSVAQALERRISTLRCQKGDQQGRCGVRVSIGTPTLLNRSCVDIAPE